MRRHKKGGYKKKREQHGLRVEVRNNNVEFALKKFKRMVKDSGLLLEVKRRTYYTKPSEVRREKKNKARLRNSYQVQKEKNSN